MANCLKAEKKRAILSMLCEGCSVRSVERLTRVHRDTILRLLVQVGRNCEAILEREIREICTQSVQCDELWTFVAKKERRLLPTDPEEFGDCYTFTALERQSKMILAFDCGKRDDETTDRFIWTLSRRVGGEVELFTDGWNSYRTAVPRHFGRRAHFTMVVKNFDRQTTDESHRYSPPKVVNVDHVWIQGLPRAGLVSTSHVERSNWTVRTYLRRFTRLSNGFSRKRSNLRAAVALFVCWYNWCKRHTSIGMTPAMAAGLTNEIWPIEKLIPN